MTRRSLFLAALLLALALPACAADKPKAPVLAGHVSRLQDQAWINDQPIGKAGALVHADDRIATGPGARLEIRFTDGGTLILGENARLAVDGYVYDGVKIKGASLLTIAQGAFLATTGAIARLDKRPYRIKTELATIGVRGTTFWGGDIEGGFKVLMLDGKGVVVETRTGKVELSQAGQGTAIEPGQAPGTPSAWGPERQAAAFATVSFR